MDNTNKMGKVYSITGAAVVDSGIMPLFSFERRASADGRKVFDWDGGRFFKSDDGKTVTYWERLWDNDL